MNGSTMGSSASRRSPNGWWPYRRRTGAIMVAALACVAFAAVSFAGASSRTLTKGPIPREAFDAGPTVDKALVPDFIPALGPTGDVVGYVPKSLVLSEAGGAQAADVPVYGDDLKTLVGHMVPDRGYVPLGGSRDGTTVAPVQTPGP